MNCRTLLEKEQDLADDIGKELMEYGKLLKKVEEEGLHMDGRILMEYKEILKGIVKKADTYNEINKRAMGKTDAGAKLAAEYKEILKGIVKKADTYRLLIESGRA